MNRDHTTRILKRLVDLYMSRLKDDEIPNTPIALFDDFGAFVDNYRDDITEIKNPEDDLIH